MFGKMQKTKVGEAVESAKKFGLNWLEVTNSSNIQVKCKMLFRMCKFPVIRWVNSGALMDSLVMVVKNILLYT